jgi:ribonucleoside-diphosphate reductase alpha chain
MNTEDCVIKRNGQKENISFDKILTRVKKLGGNDLSVNYTSLVQKIIDRLYDEIPTTQIDELTAQQCASLITTHGDYGELASRILVSNHHKNTPKTFYETMSKLYHFKDINNKQYPLISNELWDIVDNNKDLLEDIINYDRDYLIDYFGFKTLERAYLMRINKKIVERPQHMWLRVALGIWGNDFTKVKTTYDAMSQKYFTHATPTLFNAGTPRSQLSSCYLLAMKDDSISGIYETLSDCAKISKWAGGIGLHIHNIRASGSHIRGTNGNSNGIVPMLRVFNNTARYVDQGGGKRNGSFAIYIEPWHGDIMAFLDMKKNHGDEEQRARDLFYALWIPDEFMRRVKNDEMWTLMCPDQCKGLSDTYGEDFDILYKHYEKEGKGLRQVKARKVWFKILDSQMETGTPYMLYKDACNKKSNQKNLGTIKSSNLCVAPETLILTDKGHIEIQTLRNKTVNVWNGKEFSETTIKQTSDNSELITIEFSDGSQLTCTKYHKFYIQTKYPTSNMKQDIINSKNVSIVEAQNLKPDMKLIKCEYPIIDNKKKLKYAYTNGIFSADGTYTNITDNEERKCNFKSLEGKSYCKRHIDYQRNNEISEYCCGISYAKKPHISLYGKKIKLLEYLDYRSVGEEINNKLNCTLPVDLKDKFFVPSNYSLKSKLDWFAGYCDGDGSIAKNDTNQAMQISCIHKEFLLKIKLMLQTCGISSKVTLNMNERSSYLPDGKGGMDYYESKKLWRLLIGSNDLQKLIQLGFSPKRLIINGHKPQRNAVQFIKITHIEDNGRQDKTFCFTEKKRNAGIFNGIITSQCTEIIEYSNADQTAVCNLASIGLPKFIKQKETGWNSVKIYTKANCIYCKMAKKMLDKNDIKYEVLEVTSEEMDSFKHLFKCTYEIEPTTFPQIIVNEKYLGPYDELVKQLRSEFDYEKLHEITKIITDNLNKVIDVNFYPTEKTRRSNMLHRPIGIGVQGFADTLALMDIPFHSDLAKEVNMKIFETIYHAALERSNEMAIERCKAVDIIYNNMKYCHFPNDIHSHKQIITEEFTENGAIPLDRLDADTMKLIEKFHIKRAEINLRNKGNEFVGGAYSSFADCPASKGILQFDMWNVKPSDRYDWQHLKNNIIKFGLRNSLLVAPMPTASTSQILGNNECFEPFTSNIYVRRTIAGEFVIVNKHLMSELIALDKWNDDIKNSIIANGGSIQQLDLPKPIKDKYKIVWEIPMKHVLEMAKDRGAYICQSQSTNLWMKDPDYKKLTAMHMFAWGCGLKTGIYYLRTKAKAAPQQFTIEPSSNPTDNKLKTEDEDCLMCGA